MWRIKAVRERGIVSAHVTVGFRFLGSSPVLRKTTHGGSFVVVHLENGVEFGDLQQIFYALIQTEQLQLAAMIGDGGEARNQFTRQFQAGGQQ